MRYVAPTSELFEGPVFGNYQKALRKRQWPASLDYAQPSALSARRQDLAIALASQSFHAEHLGMCTAARLVLEAPTSQLRIAFAAAAQDEATHTEALGRYALVRSEIEPVNNQHSRMVDFLLDENSSYEERAILHTFLEGFALDQFYTLARAFRDDLLGQIYSYVRQDESRHVRLGLLALDARSMTAREDRLTALDKAEATARELGGYGDELFGWLAELEETTISTIKRRYVKHHNQRIKAVRLTC